MPVGGVVSAAYAGIVKKTKAAKKTIIEAIFDSLRGKNLLQQSITVNLPAKRCRKTLYYIFGKLSSENN